MVDMMQKLLSAIAIVLSCLATAPAFACLRTASSIHPFFPAFKDLVVKAFEKRGHCLEFRSIPPKRAELMILSGEIDIDVVRSREFIEAHPHLPWAKTPIADAQGIYVSPGDSSNKIIDIKQFSDQKVGYLLGMRWVETTLAKTTVKLESFASPEQLLSLLDKRRIDGFIIDSVTLDIWGYSNRLRMEEFWRSPPLLNLSGHLIGRAGLEKTIADFDIDWREMVVSNVVERELLGWLSQNIEPDFRYTVSGSNNWWPYYFTDKNGKPAGVLAELVPNILETARFKGQRVFLSAKDQDDALSRGVIDIEVSSVDWYGGSYPDPFVASDALFPISDIFVSKRLATLPDPSEISLDPIGTVAGYSYAHSDKWKRSDYPDEEQILAAIERNEITLGIVGESVYQGWLAKNSQSEVKSIGIHSTNRISFRVHKRLGRFLPRLNAAIGVLKKDGAFERTIARFQK